MKINVTKEWCEEMAKKETGHEVGAGSLSADAGCYAPLEIELGHGDKLVTDIYDDTNGEWVGIAISEGDCPVGEVADTGADRVSELEPLVTIVTANPKSLDVIIEACNRAKERLEA